MQEVRHLSALQSGNGARSRLGREESVSKSASPTTPYWADSASFPVFKKIEQDERAEVVIVRSRNHGPHLGVSSCRRGSLGRPARAAPRRRSRHRSHHRAPDDGDRRAADRSSSRHLGRDHAQAACGCRGRDITIEANVSRRRKDRLRAAAGARAISTADGRTRQAEIEGLQHDAPWPGSSASTRRSSIPAPLVHRPARALCEPAQISSRPYLAALRAASRARGVTSSRTRTRRTSRKPPGARDRERPRDHVRSRRHRHTRPLQGLTDMAGATLFANKARGLQQLRRSARSSRRADAEALLWDTADPYHYLRVDRGTVTITRSSAAKITRPARRRIHAHYERLEEHCARSSRTRNSMRAGPGRSSRRTTGCPYIGENGGAAVRRHRLCGQRHDLRHARRDDGARCRARRAKSLARALRSRPQDAGRRRGIT